MTSSPRASTHRGLWIIVGALVLGFAAYALKRDVGDPGTFFGRLGHYDGRWFALGLLGATANYALRFVRWELYLAKLGIRIPKPASARIFVSGFSMSISPGKMGEVMKSAMLAEEFDVSFERSAPIVFAERLTDLVALVLLVGVGSLAVPHGLALALPAFAGIAVLLAFFAVPAFGRFVLDLIGRFRLGARVAPKLRTAHDSLVSMLSPAPLLGATVIATAAWFLECVSLWAIIRGFPGISITIGQATFAYAAPTIAGAVALMPGGLVVTEASMTGTLRLLTGGAMSVPVAAAATLLVRLATLWWAVLLGVCALAISRRLSGESSSTIRGTKTDVDEAKTSPVDVVPGP